MSGNPSNSKPRLVAVRVDEEMDLELQAIAAADERSVSFVIRAAIREYIQRRRTGSVA